MSTTLKEAIANKKLNSGIFDVALLELVVRRVVREMEDLRGEKGNDGKNADENAVIASVLAKIRVPKDGKDGADGRDGADGADGKNGGDGANANEEKIIRRVLSRIEIPAPKDGRDGKDASVNEKALRKMIKEEIEERVGNKKITVADIAGLPKTIESLRVARNLGGHGGTMQTITATGIGNMKYNLSKTVNPLEIQVFVGGARLFEENGDFSYPAGGHISQITLAAQFDVQVQSGTLLNVRGK